MRAPIARRCAGLHFGRHPDRRPDIHYGDIHPREKYFKRGEPMPVAMVLGGDPLARLLLRRPRSALRRVRDRHYRRLARPAGADGARQSHRPALPRRRGDRARRIRHAGPARGSRARSANGAVIMPAAPCLPPSSTSRRSTIATIRSWSACRRWAPVPDEMARYRAVLRSATIKQNMMNAGVPGVQQILVSARSAARGSSMAYRSRSVIPAMPCKPVTSPLCGASTYASKYIVVVDDDVDVSNLDHLLWAMFTCAPTRCNRSVHQGVVGFAGRPGAAAIAPRLRRHDPFGRRDRCLPASSTGATSSRATRQPQKSRARHARSSTGCSMARSQRLQSARCVLAQHVGCDPMRLVGGWDAAI